MHRVFQEFVVAEEAMLQRSSTPYLPRRPRRSRPTAASTPQSAAPLPCLSPEVRLASARRRAPGPTTSPPSPQRTSPTGPARSSRDWAGLCFKPMGNCLKRLLLTEHALGTRDLVLQPPSGGPVLGARLLRGPQGVQVSHGRALLLGEHLR